MKAKEIGICLGIGPGGIKCPCCTDNAHKRINAKKFYNKRGRKLLKKALKKILKEL